MDQKLKDELERQANIAPCDITVGREISFQWFPDMSLKGEDYKEVERRVQELTEDLGKILEFDELKGEDRKKAKIKFYTRFKKLKEITELSLADILKGYLGIDGYHFAKGIIKDIVEEGADERGMHELRASIEVR